MKILSLHIYPIKSLRAIDVQEATVLPWGLQYDRQWMLVDAEGRFMSQRENAGLATLSTRLCEGLLTVQKEGFGSVDIAIPFDGPSRRVKIWKDEVSATEASDEVNGWFSEALTLNVSLVQMPVVSERPCNINFSKPGDTVSFADGFPLLLTTTASLADLNNRLDAQVPMNRFRPNVVVNGSTAWAEDDWNELDLGTVAFRVAKPCGRCLVPNINQATGIRASEEPLATLTGFRLRGNSVDFGVNLIPDGEGALRVGDDVMVRPL